MADFERRWACEKDLSTRKPPGQGQGRGGYRAAIIGRLDEYVHRYYTKFDDLYGELGPGEPAVGTITSAVVVFHTDENNTDIGIGSGASLLGERLTSEFDDDNHDTWVAEAYMVPQYTTGGGVKKSTGIPTTHGTVFEVDVRNFVQQWAPEGVTVQTASSATGLAGKGVANRGIRWRTPDDGKPSQRLGVMSQHADVDFNDRPHIRITYVPKNQKPTATWDTPVAGASSTGTHYTGTYSDPEGGTIAAAQVRVYVEGETDPQKHKWQSPETEATDVWPDGRYDIDPPPVGTLPKRKNDGSLWQYEGQARVKDNKGAWSDWTSKADGRFSLTSDAPTVSIPANLRPGTVAMLKTERFRAPWTFDEGVGLASYEVQLTNRTTPGSPAWATPIWDSGPRPVRTAELAPQGAAAPQGRADFAYTGPDLPAGDYSWRIRVTDRVNETSEWAEDDTLALTAPYTDEFDQDNSTAYGRQSVRVRIVLRAVNRQVGGRRAPGRVVGIIEDPYNLGISSNATTPGQLYFTLPNGHPQVAVVEPFATHYTVEQYRASQWKVLHEGYIVDFDASDNDTIFYGLDYLGVLSLSVEHQKQPDEKDEAAWEFGGAKYFKKRIHFVINDQLKRAIGIYGTAAQEDAQRDRSLLGFFGTPSVETMDNDVTIHAAFVQRLDFIRGLIDSYKGGGIGRRPRITAMRNPFTGVYEMKVRANTGKDRPNLRLEYGSLIQGYRVMAMGDFAVRAFGVGRKRNELKPMFVDVTAPSTPPDDVLLDWGSIAKANVFADLADLKDLERRTRQLVRETSRVGKRIAIGFRVHSLAPLDGWDICDSIPIDIDDGTVNTANYGSGGYWTIWGYEWRVYPDGHDEMTLVTKPKETADTADPGLIDSVPIHTQPEWFVGNTPPTPMGPPP